MLFQDSQLWNLTDLFDASIFDAFNGLIMGQTFVANTSKLWPDTIGDTNI